MSRTLPQGQTLAATKDTRSNIAVMIIVDDVWRRKAKNRHGDEQEDSSVEATDEEAVYCGHDSHRFPGDVLIRGCSSSRWHPYAALSGHGHVAKALCGNRPESRLEPLEGFSRSRV